MVASFHEPVVAREYYCITNRFSESNTCFVNYYGYEYAICTFVVYLYLM